MVLVIVYRVPPIDVRTHGSVRPNKPYNWRLNAHGMKLPRRRRRRHSVLSVRIIERRVHRLLVLREAGRELKTGRARELRAWRSLVCERLLAGATGVFAQFEALVVRLGG